MKPIAIFTLLVVAIIAMQGKYWVESAFNRRIFAATATGQTEVQRMSKFNASDYVIDLLDPMHVMAQQGGNLSRMSLSTLPSLEFQGIAMTLIHLEPCGINTPHTHPRASEAIYTISGSNITIGFIEENGGKVILNNVRQGQATFVPQGAIHFEQNNACEPVVLIAANNHEDPGVLTIATQFWSLPDGTLEASTGASQDVLRGIRNNGIPESPGPGTQECRMRCGISQQM